MNNRIAGIVNALFQDTAETEETVALHEEVMNNCQEHFEDLIAHGQSEDEAAEIIEESLKGMKEVIAEYPRKEGAAETPEEEDEQGGRWVFPGVTRIHADLREQDIEVIPSLDDQVHLRCDDPERVILDVADGCLTVKAADRASRASEALRDDKPEEMTLSGILSYVGRVVRKFSTQMSYNGPLEILVPRKIMTEMKLNTVSGDISYQGPIADVITLHTASGDIEIDPSDDATMERVSAGAASGDVKLHGSAAEAELNSMSGDVSATGAFDTIRIRSVSGDAEFSGSAVKLTLHSVSGDAEATIENNSIQWIEAKSTSGDVEIMLPEGLEGVHAEYTSRSGSCYCKAADAGFSAPVQIRASTVSGSVRIQ